MSSVWAVEQGEYSDYHIVGIYSMKERAKALCAQINSNTSTWNGVASVKEFQLDPVFEELNQGLGPWEVTMLRDGTVSHSGRRSFNPEMTLESDLIPLKTGSKARCLASEVWAKDEEHAIKIVNEKRAQLIASGEWI